MTTVSMEGFAHWLEMYGSASKRNDPQASADLFTADARYYETPFAEPLVGRDAIYRYWEGGAQALADKESSFEILALRDNVGIARWQSRFTRLKNGERIALDCLFVVTLDARGLCSEFREWWHTKVVSAGDP